MMMKKSKSSISALASDPKGKSRNLLLAYGPYLTAAVLASMLVYGSYNMGKQESLSANRRLGSCGVDNRAKEEARKQLEDNENTAWETYAGKSLRSIYESDVVYDYTGATMPLTGLPERHTKDLKKFLDWAQPIIASTMFKKENADLPLSVVRFCTALRNESRRFDALFDDSVIDVMLQESRIDWEEVTFEGRGIGYWTRDVQRKIMKTEIVRSLILRSLTGNTTQDYPELIEQNARNMFDTLTKDFPIRQKKLDKCNLMRCLSTVKDTEGSLPNSDDAEVQNALLAAWIKCGEERRCGTWAAMKVDFVAAVDKYVNEEYRLQAEKARLELEAAEQK